MIFDVSYSSLRVDVPELHEEVLHRPRLHHRHVLVRRPRGRPTPTPRTAILRSTRHSSNLISGRDENSQAVLFDFSLFRRMLCLVIISISRVVLSYDFDISEQ